MLQTAAGNMLGSSCVILLIAALLGAAPINALVRQNLSTVELEGLNAAVADLIENVINTNNSRVQSEDFIFPNHAEMILERPVNVSIRGGRIEYQFNATWTNATLTYTIPGTAADTGEGRNFTVEMQLLDCRLLCEGAVRVNASACELETRLVELDQRTRINITNVTSTSSSHRQDHDVVQGHNNVLPLLNEYVNAPNNIRRIFYFRDRGSSSEEAVADSEEDADSPLIRDTCSGAFLAYLQEHDVLAE